MLALAQRFSSKPPRLSLNWTRFGVIWTVCIEEFVLEADSELTVAPFHPLVQHVAAAAL